MINEIPRLSMPGWLQHENFTFDICNILKDSLYYPCAEFDGSPVKYFMGNVYSFIYVDYGVSRDRFLEAIKNQGFRGYKVKHQQTVARSELVPSGWNIKIEPNKKTENPEIFYTSWVQKPFCEWIVFERCEGRDDSYNPKRFSLLYLCADGAAAYQALYLSNGMNPNIIAIIQPEGGNYSGFRNREDIFARSVFYNKRKLPMYLINGGGGPPDLYDNAPWREYNTLIKKINSDREQLVIWKYNNEIN